jgi:hypothetical protein
MQQNQTRQSNERLMKVKEAKKQKKWRAFERLVLREWDEGPTNEHRKQRQSNEWGSLAGIHRCTGTHKHISFYAVSSLAVFCSVNTSCCSVACFSSLESLLELVCDSHVTLHFWGFFISVYVTIFRGKIWV